MGCIKTYSGKFIQNNIRRTIFWYMNKRTMKTMSENLLK